MRRQTPLPTRATEAFHALRPAIEATDEGLEREEARAVLLDGSFEAGEVADLLDILLERGYLYAVDGHLRVTG